MLFEDGPMGIEWKCAPECAYVSRAIIFFEQEVNGLPVNFSMDWSQTVFRDYFADFLYAYG